MDNLNVLIGQRVTALYVKAGEEAIAFVTERGTFAFDTDADCCSETWFADVLNPQALFAKGWNGTVRKITEMKFPDHDDRKEDPRSRQEYDELMGFELHTGAGVCQVLYRNSSNGYYGGSLGACFVPESLEGWTQITTDWQAGATP